MFLELRLRPVVRFLLFFEGRVYLTEPVPGAGLDDEFLAVVHCRRFLLWPAVDARPGLRGMQRERDARRVSGAKAKSCSSFPFSSRVAPGGCGDLSASDQVVIPSVPVLKKKSIHEYGGLSSC